MTDQKSAPTGPSNGTRDIKIGQKAGHSGASSSLSIHLALLVVQIAFGSLAVEGKLAMSPRFGVKPESLAMMRILGGALVFVPANLLWGGSRLRSARGWATMATLSLFGIVLNQALFLRGLSLTSPVSATLLVATIPVMTALVSVLVGKDKLHASSALGFVVAVLGVVVLSGFAVPHAGDAFVLLNALSYAVYVVYSKGALAEHGTLAVMAWVFGLGTLLFAPVGAVSLIHDAPRWSAGTIGLVAFVVLVPTVIAYGVNAWALRRASPMLVTTYVYLQPLIVVALAAVQLGQTPTTQALLGGMCVLAGVAIVVRGQQARDRQTRRNAL